jgi:hypothetical protein
MLPSYRLDLTTKTLDYENSLDWTSEEITAWLDSKELETQRIEEQEQEAFNRRGGFTGERGVGSMWRQINAEIEVDQAIYRFCS